MPKATPNSSTSRVTSRSAAPVHQASSSKGKSNLLPITNSSSKAATIKDEGEDEDEDEQGDEQEDTGEDPLDKEEIHDDEAKYLQAIQENEAQAFVEAEADVIDLQADEHLVSRLWKTLTDEEKETAKSAIPFYNSRFLDAQAASHRYNPEIIGDRPYLGPLFVSTPDQNILKPVGQMGTFSCQYLRRIRLEGGMVVQRMGMLWGILMVLERETSERGAGWLGEKSAWAMSHPGERVESSDLVDRLVSSEDADYGGLYMRQTLEALIRIYVGMSYTGTIAARQTGHWNTRNSMPSNGKLAAAYERCPNKDDWCLTVLVRIPVRWRGLVLGKSFTYVAESSMMALFNSISDSYGLNTRLVDEGAFKSLSAEQVETLWDGMLLYAEQNNGLPGHRERDVWTAEVQRILPGETLSYFGAVRFLRCESYSALTIPLSHTKPLPANAWQRWANIPYTTRFVHPEETAFKVNRDRRKAKVAEKVDPNKARSGSGYVDEKKGESGKENGRRANGSGPIRHGASLALLQSLAPSSSKSSRSSKA